MATVHAPRSLDSIERRYGFAAWPQTYAHASWLEWLDAATGLQVLRCHDHRVGIAEQAVAQALWQQAGINPSQRVAIDRVPLWAMQTHAPLHQQLSTVAGLMVWPVLKRMVNGEHIRQWDAVLSPALRQTVQLLARTHPELAAPPDAQGWYASAATAAQTVQGWDQFCLRLGLTALQEYGPAVQARFRLAWPEAFKKSEPFTVALGMQAWLVNACDKVAKVLPEVWPTHAGMSEGAA